MIIKFETSKNYDNNDYYKINKTENIYSFISIFSFNINKLTH